MTVPAHPVDWSKLYANNAREPSAVEELVKATQALLDNPRNYRNHIRAQAALLALGIEEAPE